jgi:hypothetical protein
MKLGVLAGGPDDQTAAATWNEDQTERYRVDVERRLADRLVLPDEDAVERFFEHVIASFDRGVSPSECARAWLVSVSARSAER